jgi:parallel beta-helix repeat protein
MLKSASSYCPSLMIAGALAGTLLLTACGGGKSGSPEAATSPSSGGSTASSGTAASSGSAASAAAAELPGTLTPVAEALGNMDQQQATMAFALAATATTADGTAGNSYYIDSRSGDDSNDGKSATVGANGAGPWKTLGRIMKATIAAGDSVRLVCGSSWGETLQLPTSGIAGKPIVVTSYPGSCATPPIIDGSVMVNNANWTQHSGNVYRAPLATEPLMVNAPNGVMTIAHYPNRGHDSSLPSSVFLRTAGDSDSVSSGGSYRSTYLVTGSDLAAGKITAGTKIRIRPSAWILDETTVASVSGSRINLTAPTRYPVKAGWGYYFVGQSWMLDSPGEWFYDSGAKMLYAWMPDSAVPRSVLSTQLPVGIDLTSRRYVTLNNLIVRQVGTGIAMPGSSNITVQYVSIRDTAGMGIDGARGAANTVTYSSLIRTGGDAISAADATGMKVLYNTINQSGVLVSGDTVLSLPTASYGGIRPGAQGEVTGNTVIDTGYSGIWPGSGTKVNNNYVRGACSVLDDCAGIYASQPNHNGIITGNFVENSRGALEGKSNTTPARTQAQGIYLDEGASGVVVDNNTVINADNGIQLHIAANNTIKNNKLYGNRSNQIWLQETSNRVRTTGDLYGNAISNNQLVPTTANSRGFLLETMIKNSELFAQLDWNRYFDRTFARIGSDLNPTNSADYTLPDWKSAVKSDGTPRNQDPNASGASEVKLASWVVSGTNIVPNGSLSSSLLGWAAHNDIAPKGTIVRESCAAGYCAHYTSGASPGLVSSPNFSVVAGQWYRASVDVMGSRDNQPLNMVVRRGGGGSNGYEGLMSPSVTVMASKTFKRYSFTFQATKTVTAGDPVTGDFGARFDSQQIQPGDQVWISNLSIVPISAATVSTRTDILKNTTLDSVQANCPVATTALAMCASYARMSDNSPVTWPLTLGPRSSEIVYTRDSSLVDSDGDGIADSQDSCPNTTKGQQVNASGCAFGQ